LPAAVACWMASPIASCDLVVNFASNVPSGRSCTRGLGSGGIRHRPLVQPRQS
jgi:hypothetical protein